MTNDADYFCLKLIPSTLQTPNTQEPNLISNLLVFIE